MPVLLALLLPLTFPVCILLGQMAHADFCLDSGGSWDYHNQICDLKESHPRPK